MKIEEIISNAPDKIVERGESYYRNNFISSVVQDKKGMIKAKVEGSRYKPYIVKIELRGNEVIDYSCNCPYDYGDVCKHIIAVLLAIKDGNHLKYSDEKSKLKDFDDNNDEIFEEDFNEKNLLKSLKHASKKEIIDFLIDYSGINHKLKHELLKHFVPNQSFLIEEIKNYVDEVKSNSYYKDFVDDDDISYIAGEFEYIIDSYENKLTEKNCESAFHTALEILVEAVGLLEYASEYGFNNLEEVNGDALNLLKDSSRILEKYGNSQAKENAFKVLIRKTVTNKFNHYISQMDLLQIAIIFVNENNKDFFYNNINNLLKTKQDTYSYESYLIDNKILHKMVIEKLEGGEAAKKYMIENIQIDSFLETLINESIDNKNFSFAEKLCIDKITKINKISSIKEYNIKEYNIKEHSIKECNNKEHNFKDNVDFEYNYKSKKWFEYLYVIYNSSENKEKEIATCYILLKTGDPLYYDILKNLFKEKNIWNEKQDSLIEMARIYLNVYDYSDILEKEEKWDLLFASVKKVPESIFEYGKNLGKIYGTEVFEIYKPLIEFSAQRSDSRAKYRDVCKLIRNLYDAGGHDIAIKIIKNFQVTYKRRPAFQEELNLLEHLIELS
ncbi:SWIM zinc finger family protein [Methanobrevibacter curvatus]|uniref:SWIM-type domain-containing protein n=1 Tax=Methanobrevibacter curvatus TaxID=49547 RepID=A0A166C8Y0_9EURY|nr:SWIM zinc finger family protein [Methanobrevibacter curvatus]KZX12317.1 hypothetical protein MBCUR_10740 [Methanobrevibacter curvatus]